MKKEEKNQIIDSLVEKLNKTNHFYLTDISGMAVEETNRLRRLCFKRDVELVVVKNTLLQKALEKTGKDYPELVKVLHGPTSVMFTEVNNVPAKVIEEFRKKSKKPILKSAFVEESCFIGDNQIAILSNLKSKNELLGEIIGLLQSPAKNVLSALQSGGNTIAGIVKTLSEK